MSFSGQFRAVNRCRRLFVFVLGVLLVTPIASAGPQLWLYPKDAGPREGGHVVPPGTFTLVIENRGNGSGDTTAYGVTLVVAVEDPDAVDTVELVHESGNSVAVDLEGMEQGTPTLLCSHKPMPRHGVYPAAYTLVVLKVLTGFGDLADGESVEIEVTVGGQDNLRVHFDAMATGLKQNPQGEKCFDISNPSGHDVTVANRQGGPDECGRVRISKTADSRFVDIGDRVTFVIEVANEGSCALSNLVLEDRVPVVYDGNGDPHPAFLIEAYDPAPYDFDELFVEWHLEPPLAVGEKIPVSLDVLFDDFLADGQRVINRACISAAELRKPRCAAAVVYVGNPHGDDGPASPGFWCHAARFALEGRRNAPVEAEDFETWLDEIGEGSEGLEGSNVFHNEPYDASTLELARDLLCTPHSAEGAADRLVRHLLTLWLNVVSGRLAMDQELDELCDGDELMPEDVVPATVMELIVAIEDALVLPAEDQELTYWSEVVDAVNNSLVPGEPGCTAARVTSGRQRAGNGKPGSKMKIPGVHN
jgi:uncharacterized repeat protein (TIGR01451 family)